MKTLITNLYQNFSNRLQIDLEFQYVTVTNNYEQTSTKYNVFINQKNDFGNFKVQPYIKFTYLKTKANNPSALEQTPAIYLSLYHIYDLKRNFRKTMKFFESNAYVRDQNGNLSIGDELQRQSAWEISNIGAKNHFIKCFNSVTARTITDYSGNETEKVVEPTAILSLDTMNGQAVAIPYNDFKSLYMLINDINFVDLIMQSGIAELIHATSKGTTNSIYENKTQYNHNKNNYNNNKNNNGYYNKQNPTIANSDAVYQKGATFKSKPVDTSTIKSNNTEALPPRNEMQNAQTTEQQKPLVELVSNNVDVDNVPENSFDSDDAALEEMFNE